MHCLCLKAPINRLAIVHPNNLPTVEDRRPLPTWRRQAERLICTENLPCPLSCIALGGNPPPEIDLYIGDQRTALDESVGFRLNRTVTLLNGPVGLRAFRFRSERCWRSSNNDGDFRVDWTMDGSELWCAASVPGLTSNYSKIVLTVRRKFIQQK